MDKLKLLVEGTETDISDIWNQLMKEIEENADKYINKKDQINLPELFKLIAFTDPYNQYAYDLFKKFEEIGIDVFENNPKLESRHVSVIYIYDKNVVLPESIEYIDAYAFSTHRILKTIKLPTNLKKIGNYAFYNCIGLKSINIPENITKLEIGTFCWCLRLESILLPKNLTYVSKDAFKNCISLTKVIITNPDIEIAPDAFKSCNRDKLTFVTKYQYDRIQEYCDKYQLKYLVDENAY